MTKDDYLKAMEIDVYVPKEGGSSVDFNILCEPPNEIERALLGKILIAIGSRLNRCTINGTTENLTQLAFGQTKQCSNCINLPSLREMADNPKSKRFAWQTLKSKLSI